MNVEWIGSPKYTAGHPKPLRAILIGGNALAIMAALYALAK